MVAAHDGGHSRCKDKWESKELLLNNFQLVWFMLLVHCDWLAGCIHFKSLSGHLK